MGKKKRVRNKSVFIALEGEREKTFLCFLQSLFDPSENKKLKFPSDLGGTSNAILDRALKAPHEKCFAWFDEDDKIDDEHREELEKRWGVSFSADLYDRDLQKQNVNNKNPIIIVSNPYSIEGMLIRLFDKNPPKLINPITSKKDFEENKKNMKSSVKGIFGKTSELEYYKKNLTKNLIIAKSEEIYELKLLLSIFDIK